MPGPETFIIGQSEDCEAEYGFRADAAVSLLSMCNDEIYCVEGFATIADATASLKNDDVAPSQIIRF